MLFGFWLDRSGLGMRGGYLILWACGGLTLGALAHFGYRGLRAALAPRVAATRPGQVIDGEYHVVARGPVRTLPRAG